MPTAYGAEFRQDVIDVARKGEAPLAQIAKDFGLSVTTLKRWIAIAERKDSGAGPALSESAEVRELKKRNRLLEQENEILRRAAAYLARDINPNDLPAGHGSCRRRCSSGGDLQGVGLQQARLLPVEDQPGDRTGLGGCAPGQRCL
ncbi:transposase-like protein [Paenarthrobacter sp. A20]|nr:transposase-like protein [Paenarthrobacter sp. A20]